MKKKWATKDETDRSRNGAEQAKQTREALALDTSAVASDSQSQGLGGEGGGRSTVVLSVSGELYTRADEPLARPSRRDEAAPTHHHHHHAAVLQQANVSLKFC